MRTLEYFVVLAQSRSINEAAKKLYIAQPSLTKSLQAMELELGVPLFERTGSGIRLTEAGEKVLPQARQVLEYYNDWKHLAMHSSLRQMDLYIHTSLSGFLVPGLIVAGKERYPELSVNYAVTLRPEAMLAREGEHPALALAICDAAAPAQGVPGSARCKKVPLIHGEYGCLVSRKSELAARASVRVEELPRYVFIAPDLPPLGQLVEKREVATPIVSRVFSSIPAERMVRVGTAENVINLVQSYPQGYALACWPACLRYGPVQSGEAVYAPFEDAGAKVDVCLFYQRLAYREYPAVRELVRAVKRDAAEFCRENGVPQTIAETPPPPPRPEAEKA